MAGHRNDKVTTETTLIEIAIGRIKGIDRATLLQVQVIDIAIEVETRIVIGNSLDKAMLLVQEIAVMGEALESTLQSKLPDAITTKTTTTTRRVSKLDKSPFINTTNSRASYSHIYINLYQSVGDKIRITV